MLLFTAFSRVQRIEFLANVSRMCLRSNLHRKIYFPEETTSRGKTTVTPRRAILYVPGHDKRKIEKIKTLNVDCAVLDLEDGVAINKKDEARDFLCQIPTEFDFGLTECAVRINSVESGLAEKDLTALFSAKRFPSTIMVPKVDSVEHVKWINNLLSLLSKERTFQQTVNLFLFVESAQSLLDLRSICQITGEIFARSPFSLDGLVFGSDDFCADIGATRTSDAVELLTARQMIVMIAKLFRLQVIDMVHIDYKDVEGLKKHSREGADMGFTGKQIIHPCQIEIVQNAFSPSEAKIAWATELIKLFEEHQKEGKGAFTFQGAMIDKPLLLHAEYVVKLSKILKRS